MFVFVGVRLMVIVKLQGGLGNQMFQYAAGRTLSMRLGTPLKMDRRIMDNPLKGSTPWTYALGALNVREEFADSLETAELSGRGQTRLREFTLRFRRVSGLSPRRAKVLRDADFRFNPEFLEMSGDVYLDGYWQSEKYFLGISGTIRREFSLRRPLEGADRELAEAIVRENSVSIHVRRGDYVSNPAANRFHGLCGAGYYGKCIAIVSEKVASPRFLVFTDDPAWARENMSVPPGTVFVDWDLPRDGSVDLELMRRCRHHIIANSSFSWWGAWLADHPGKVILAPERWFDEPTMDTRDLLPESWIKVQAIT